MLEFTETPFWNRTNAISSWKHYIGNDPKTISPYASPLSAQDFSHLPPAFILVCELDPLRDEGIMYAQKLMQAQVAVELQVIPGAIHVFNLFPSKLSERFYATQVRVLRDIFE